MPRTCNKCRTSLEGENRGQAKLLRIEYEATMAAMEALLHHYRILALRLEQLVAGSDEPSSA